MNAVATFEKAEHSAAETLALSGHVANRDHAKAVATAADQKWFSMAEEDADLAKDLAAEEETRQIAYASPEWSQLPLPATDITIESNAQASAQ